MGRKKAGPAKTLVIDEKGKIGTDTKCERVFALLLP